MIRRPFIPLSGRVHTAILGRLLQNQAVKSVALTERVSENTVRRIASEHCLAPLLVLPAERRAVLASRGKIARA